MNCTGTYVHVPGQGLVRISDAVPHVASAVYFNKGGVPQYDPSAREMFQSRSDKRRWLTQHGMKEGGIIRNADKRWDGPVKNASKYRPTGEQKRLKEARVAYIQSQGGVNGLLDKFQKTGGRNGKATG